MRRDTAVSPREPLRIHPPAFDVVGGPSRRPDDPQRRRFGCRILKRVGASMVLRCFLRILLEERKKKMSKC
jgi:hypothetical protein